MHEYVENLRSSRNPCGTSGQFPTVRIKYAVPENELQFGPPQSSAPLAGKAKAGSAPQQASGKRNPTVTLSSAERSRTARIDISLDE